MICCFDVNNQSNDYYTCVQNKLCPSNIRVTFCIAHTSTTFSHILVLYFDKLSTEQLSNQSNHGSACSTHPRATAHQPNAAPHKISPAPVAELVITQK
jgi:hypothetical protein